MTALGQARPVGGIGSTLTLLILVPRIRPLLVVAGSILALIAVKYISDHVGDRVTFNNYLVAVIINIVAVIIILVMGDRGAPRGVRGAQVIGPSSRHILAIRNLGYRFHHRPDPRGCGAVFIRRSFNSIAARLDVMLFSTVGLLYLIGAALMMILVGGLIPLAALIL